MHDIRHSSQSPFLCSQRIIIYRLNWEKCSSANYNEIRHVCVRLSVCSVGPRIMAYASVRTYKHFAAPTHTHNKTQIRCCAIKLMIWRCLSNKTIVVHLAVVDDINLYRFRYIYMYRSIDISNTSIHCVATLNGKKFLLNHPAHQFLHSHRPF